MRTFFLLLTLLFPLTLVAEGIERLTPGSTISGFHVEALYVDDAGATRGARLVHRPTGFTLDLLSIASLPQVFVWVNSLPTSSMGEPHTQEHLLLGKGNMGRFTASVMSMTLTESSAFTQQWRTAYHSQVSAGPDAFFTSLSQQLDALLHPDYTDEEISREVCNYGVVTRADGSLTLEEKGTVYNEMVRTYENPWVRVSAPLDTLVHGREHPLAYSSGGEPAAIRRMRPEDIRRFHRENYRLANMGMVASLPPSMAIDASLARLDTMLQRLDPSAGEATPVTPTFPPSHPGREGSIVVTGYPSASASGDGPVIFAWPATLRLSEEDHSLLGLFLENIAGDASSELYRRFVDASTRSVDCGASDVYGWASDDPGMAVQIRLVNVDADWITAERIAQLRSIVLEEIGTIASLPADAPERKAFDERLLSRLDANRRELRQFIASPPGFGFRGSGSRWMEHLRMLARLGGERRSLTLATLIDRLRARVAQPHVWRDLIAAARLTSITPYASGARPDPTLREREGSEREERIAAEIARVRRELGGADDQEALRRYRDRDLAIARALDSVAALVPMPRFVSTPPLSVDPDLTWRSRVIGGVPLVEVPFEGIDQTTTGLALSLGHLTKEDLLYLPVLPTLMQGAGLAGRRTIPYDQLDRVMQEEILSLDVSFSTNPDRGRYELLLRATGNDSAEARRGLEWISMVLEEADLRPSNLARLRDLVESELSSLRTTMQGAEERWVHGPAAAWRLQNDRLFLTTGSFLTQAHALQRLAWQLIDPDSAGGAAALGPQLDRLVAAGGGIDVRTDLRAKIAAIAAGETSLSEEGSSVLLQGLAGDLVAMIDAMPPQGVAAIWRELGAEMKRDVLMSPTAALAGVARLREHLIAGERRLFTVGSPETLASLRDRLQLLARSGGAPARTPLRDDDLIVANLRRRGVTEKPLFVGLVNEGTSSGVFVHSASSTSYADTSRSALLDYLAMQSYGGHGAHGIFMKTWGAGLAYSNGLSSNLRTGRIGYYAERCPALPQTLDFVAGELRKGSIDTSLLEYAVAQAFNENRGGGRYGWRGEAMANDLADGVTPDRVSDFRRRLLSLRRDEDLAAAVGSRLADVCGRVLPGLGPSPASVDGGSFFVTGPERQMELYEEYLRSQVDPGSRVVRLYPSDFWIW